MFSADFGDAMGYVQSGKKAYRKEVGKGRKSAINASTNWTSLNQHGRWGEDAMRRDAIAAEQANRDVFNPFYQTGVQATNQYNDLMSGAADAGLIQRNQAAIDLARQDNDRAQNARGSFYSGKGLESDTRVLNQQIGDLRGQQANILGQGMQIGMGAGQGIAGGIWNKNNAFNAGNQLYSKAFADRMYDQNNWRRDMEYGHGQLLGNAEMWAASQLANLSSTEEATNAKMGNALLSSFIGAGTKMATAPGGIFGA